MASTHAVTVEINAKLLAQNRRLYWEAEYLTGLLIIHRVVIAELTAKYAAVGQLAGDLAHENTLLIGRCESYEAAADDEERDGMSARDEYENVAMMIRHLSTAHIPLGIADAALAEADERLKRWGNRAIALRHERDEAKAEIERLQGQFSLAYMMLMSDRTIHLADLLDCEARGEAYDADAEEYK